MRCTVDQIKRGRDRKRDKKHGRRSSSTEEKEGQAAQDHREENAGDLDQEPRGISAEKPYRSSEDGRDGDGGWQPK